MRLDGKRVVIIGGSSGIGLETARLALAEGASVTIAGRSEDRLRRAVENLLSTHDTRTAPDRLRSVVADVTEESSLRALFGGEARLDHLFLPAGELRPGGGCALTSDLPGLRAILESRLLGVAHVVRQARPRMAGGSITLMSGLYSTRPARGGAFAAAAVAAVEGMTRALALDLAPIRVNAVAPGLIDTPLSWAHHHPIDLLAAAVVEINRLSTCVTLARLTPRKRASAARLSNWPESSSDW